MAEWWKGCICVSCRTSVASSPSGAVMSTCSRLEHLYEWLIGAEKISVPGALITVWGPAAGEMDFRWRKVAKCRLPGAGGRLATVPPCGEPFTGAMSCRDVNGAKQPCEETVRQYLNKFVRKEPAREKSQETLREERSEDDLNPCRRKVRRRRLLKDRVSLETLLRFSSSITQRLGNVKRYKPSQHTAGPRGFSHPKIN
ncbi:hypothetical protein Bbelb_353320 [Branchiostoma belcheri]|nr:hypothetical protein Bbelb_353320 [Branchiostoma belcheri]